jgi:Flp pilus assembly protein TadG
MKSRLHPLLYKQQGTAAVEFGLVAIVFFILLLGVVEMGRVLFTWNAAVEATRYGARVATVCDIDDTAVVDRMRRIMPNLTTGNINVEYQPTGCTKDGAGNTTSCRWVKVSIEGFSVTTHIPVVSALLNLPPFTTTLPRESLDSAGGTNPICI